MGRTFSTYGREERYIQRFSGETEGRNHLEDRGIDRRVILKWIFKRLDKGALTGLIWLRIGVGGGLL